ncbi:MAG: hypothetical protein V1908_01620 [Candidatus Peregrinibacteria bacterium]
MGASVFEEFFENHGGFDVIQQFVFGITETDDRAWFSVKTQVTHFSEKRFHCPFKRAMTVGGTRQNKQIPFQ